MRQNNCSGSVLYNALYAIVLENKSKIAIQLTSGRSVTYGQLLGLISSISNGFYKNKVKPNDTIATVLSNSIEYVALIFACAKIGISYVPILENFSADYVKLALDISGAKYIVVDGSRRCLSFNIPVLEVNELVKNAPLKKQYNETTYSGVFRKLWSSGSTGFPKMIIWRQDKLLLERQRWIRNTGINDCDIFFCRHPLDVAHATDLHVFSSLLSGATLIIMDNKMNDEAILKYINENKVTSMSALPNHYDEMSKAANGKETSLIHLRNPWCGGAYLSFDIMIKVNKKLNINIKQLYGSTDFGLAMVNMKDQLQSDLSMTIINGVEAHIKPIDNSSKNIGELILYSDLTSDGYVNNDIENEKSFKNGFYHTGDIAEIIRKDTFRILGRVNDLVMTNKGIMLATLLNDEILKFFDGVNTITYASPSNSLSNHVIIFVIDNNIFNKSIFTKKIKFFLHEKEVFAKIIYLREIPTTPVGKIDKPSLLKYITEQEVNHEV